jgi:tRNA (guanine37-N1)-methyltransferase
MRIDVITLFPEMFKGPFEESIFKKARQKNIFEIYFHQLRDFATDKHKTVDDSVYGGGAGMVFKPEPLFAALRHIMKEPKRPEVCVIYPSPKGPVLTHQKAVDLSKFKQLVFICGRYEGIDQRVIDYWVDEQISIGNYVLTGGELPAMVMIDTIVRQIPGVVGKGESLIYESHAVPGQLEYPHYTKPEVFEGLKVPEVLLSGHHAEIEKWRDLNTKKNP